MIRHRPEGSGHPYAVDTEQRWPVDPVAGEPVTLGVRTSGDIASVDCVMIRIAGAADGAATSTATLALAPTARNSRGRATDGGHLASAQARQARAAGGWQLILNDLRVGERLRYRFTATRTDGRVENTRWFETAVFAWEDSTEALATVGTSRVLPGSVRTLVGGDRIRRLRFALRLDVAERIAGFGERFDALDLRGTDVDSVVFEQYKNQGAERKTYLPMPFAHVVGKQGWGFHLRTTRRAWFECGSVRDDEIRIEMETDARTGASAFETTAFYDGSPTEVLDAFLDEVGRAEELPAWVFRLWGSGNEWNTQAEVMRQVNLHRDHDIPVGNVVIEAWSDESTFTAFRDAQYTPTSDGSPHRLADFTFPVEGAWPDPKGMVDELHARGIRLHLWQIPLIKMRPHPIGQAAMDAAAAIRENVLIQEETPDGSLRPYRNRGWWFPLGLMPDLTDPRAAAWWTDKRRYLVEDVGIDGFKTDGGEHAWGRDLVYLDGRHGDAANNTYPVRYAEAYGNLLRSAGKAPVTFSRAGYTGSQAHGAFWAGDENSSWDAFRWSMFAGLTAAASGIVYWGWDFAGFSGEVPGSELYVRAAAASVFVPIMQYHSEFNHHRTPSRDRTPWNIAEQSGDEQVIPVFKRLIEVRERLIPYLVEQARHTIDSSAPLMRPLFFDNPGDPLVWEYPLQWMLGDELLVNPVLEAGATTWATYLPTGEWIDVWTGTAVAGGRVHTRSVPLHEIPVYCRGESWSALRAVFES